MTTGIHKCVIIYHNTVFMLPLFVINFDFTKWHLALLTLFSSLCITLTSEAYSDASCFQFNMFNENGHCILGKLYKVVNANKNISCMLCTCHTIPYIKMWQLIILICYCDVSRYLMVFQTTVIVVLVWPDKKIRISGITDNTSLMIGCFSYIRLNLFGESEVNSIEMVKNYF